MNELLTKVLKEVIDRSPRYNPYVFSSPKTRKPLTNIKTTFTKAVKRIGLEGFRFKNYVTHGVLGCVNWEWMKHYPSMDYMREAVEKLNKVMGEPLAQ